MSAVQFTQVAYGLSQPTIGLFPAPIVSATANPTSSNFAQIGTVWINKGSNAAFILTSIVNNSANWADVTGGAGVFSSLTVNPGPTALSTVGNGAVSIGNASNTGAITITVGTGNFSLVGGGNTVGIANDAAANVVTLGSLTGAASLALQSGTGGTTVTTGATGTIALGLATMTGTITLGQSTAGQTINIGNAVNTGAQVINIANGASGASSTVNVLSGVATAGTQNFNVLNSNAVVVGTANIGFGGSSTVAMNVGNVNAASVTTVRSGTAGLNVATSGPAGVSSFIRLFTTNIYVGASGAGAPANGLALAAGDMFINSTATAAANRLFIATGPGAWTFFTANA